MSKNLLYKASIVTTPTAYGEGVLNSIKPALSYGDELVTNGDMELDSGWSGVGITGGDVNERSSVRKNSGTYSRHADVDAIDKGFVSLTFPVTINTYYKVIAWIYVVSGQGRLQSGSGRLPVDVTESTTGIWIKHSFIDKASTTGDDTLLFRSQGGAAEFYIDNVSVKEVITADFDFTRSSSATRINPDYLIETSAIDTPRLDYHNGTASILLEPQSTNLITYSKDLTPYFTLDSGIILTLDYGVSPDGTINSTRLQYPSTNKGCYKVVAYAEATISLWVKGVINETILIGDYTYSASLTILTGDWQKIEVTSQISNIQISTYLGSTARDIQVWGAQLEQLSYATSYIPTSGTTQTRSADAANNAGNSDLINSTEGVLYVEIAALADDNLVDKRISISDGTNANRVLINIGNGVSNIYTYLYAVSGSNQINANIVVTDITEFHKLAVTWKANEFKVYLDGILNYTDTSGSVNPVGTFTQVQFSDGAGGIPFLGNVKCIAVFNEALTDTELACLTGTNDKEIFLNYYYRMQYVGANTEALGCAEQTFNI